MKPLHLCMTVSFLLAACSLDRPEQDQPEQDRPAEAGISWESAFVDVSGIRLHYWRTGAPGKPPWVLAHGITDYGLNWTSLARKFEDEYDMILYDARGHGLSDQPDGPYDLDTHVEDLVGLIRTLGLEKPILMGHSMGGSTVALAAARYPEIPRGVILEDPGDMLLGDEALPEEILPDWKEMVEADRAQGREALVASARAERHPGWTDLDYGLWAESKLLVDPDVVDILLGEGFGNAVETYPRISAPTLILKADAEEDRREVHRQLASSLVNGRLVHIDGAGHVIRNDRPEETEWEIRRFLAGLSYDSEG